MHIILSTEVKYPLTNNRQPNQTNAQQVRKQNQQSMQKQGGYSSNPMGEEFGSETDVEQVKQQNQQSQANKQKAATQQPNQFGNGSR